MTAKTGMCLTCIGNTEDRFLRGKARFSVGYAHIQTRTMTEITLATDLSILIFFATFFSRVTYEYFRTLIPFRIV